MSVNLMENYLKKLLHVPFSVLVVIWPVENKRENNSAPSLLSFNSRDSVLKTISETSMSL